MKINVVANDDGFLVKCSSIDGAFAEGSTEIEALRNLFDVISMIIEYKQERVFKRRVRSINFDTPITI